jgi:SAM-dependent methyltransferase
MYRVAQAEQSGIAEHGVDLILVAQALHWFDLDAFYTEASRVLKPGGVLSAVTYGPLTVDDRAVDELIQAFYHDWVGAFWPPERQHVENNYRDIGFPFPAIAAPSIEMSLHWRVVQLLGYLRSWSATDAYEKAKGENPVDRLIPLLGAINKLGDQTLKVSWPLTVLAGYAPA